MNTIFTRQLICAAIISVAPCSMVLAQDNPDQPLIKENNWYFSWGYSRQQYAPSDIHVTQPGPGNNFTVHQAAAQDFPSNFGDTVNSIVNLNFTSPQENVRIGRFLNAEKTFAVELNLDHSKYNTNLDQTAYVSGTVNNQPYNKNLVDRKSTRLNSSH